MKILIIDIVDNRDKKELYQSTTSLDCMFGINTNGIVKIGDDEIHLDEMDFVSIDDNSYTNKDFENIYKVARSNKRNNKKKRNVKYKR